jgi:hypothetical protein
VKESPFLLFLFLFPLSNHEAMAGGAIKDRTARHPQNYKNDETGKKDRQSKKKPIDLLEKACVFRLSNIHLMIILSQWLYRLGYSLN